MSSSSASLPSYNIHYPQESEFDESEGEDEEEEEDDESVLVTSLEDALQVVNVQLPRLAVSAPSSVLPPKVTMSLHGSYYSLPFSRV